MNEHTAQDIQLLIDEKRFDDADRRLDSIASEERCARWNYMKGVVLIGKGWNYDAQRYLENAHTMDPTNEEYKATFKALRKGKNMEKYFAESIKSGDEKKKRSICEECGDTAICVQGTLDCWDSCDCL